MIKDLRQAKQTLHDLQTAIYNESFKSWSENDKSRAYGLVVDITTLGHQLDKQLTETV